MMTKKFINTPGQTILIVVAIIAVLFAVYYIYKKMVDMANPSEEPKPSTTTTGTTTTTGQTNEGEAVIIAHNIVEIDSKSDIMKIFSQNIIKDIATKINTASNAQLQLIGGKLTTNTTNAYLTIKNRIDWAYDGWRSDTKAEHQKAMIKLINLIG